MRKTEATVDAAVAAAELEVFVEVMEVTLESSIKEFDVSANASPTLAKVVMAMASMARALMVVVVPDFVNGCRSQAEKKLY